MELPYALRSVSLRALQSASLSKAALAPKFDTSCTEIWGQILYCNAQGS